MFDELLLLVNNADGLILIVLAGLLWLMWRMNNRTQGLLDTASEAQRRVQKINTDLREELDKVYRERREEREEYEEKLRLQSVRIDDLSRRIETLGQERASQEADLRATIAKKDEVFAAYQKKTRVEFREMQNTVTKLKADLEAEREKYRNLQLLQERVATESAKRAERILEDTERLRAGNKQIVELTAERDALMEQVRQLVMRVEVLEKRLREFEEMRHETVKPIVSIDNVELVVGGADDGAGQPESDSGGDIRAIGDGGDGAADGDSGDSAA